MRISFSWASVECRSWQSRPELQQYLARFEHSRIIAKSNEQEREFYSVIVQPGFQSAQARRVGLGVCSEGHGVQPQLLLLPARGLLWIGANSSVIAVHADTGQDEFQILLESLLYSMVHISDREMVLVFHEIGVTAVGEDGQRLWTFARDVVENASIESGLLHVSFMDADPVALDLKSGVEVPGRSARKGST